MISNFDESRKLTAKRKIIDEFENNLTEGFTMLETIHLVLGDNFIIEHSSASIVAGEIEQENVLRKVKSIKSNSIFLFSYFIANKILVRIQTGIPKMNHRSVS